MATRTFLVPKKENFEKPQAMLPWNFSPTFTVGAKQGFYILFDHDLPLVNEIK